MMITALRSLPDVDYNSEEMDLEGNFLTIRQVAERLGVTRQNVWHHVNSGTLPAQKIGNQYLIREEDISKIEGLKPGPKPSDDEEEII